jgi:hypothetical protein
MRVDNKVALDRALASEALVSELSLRICDVQMERDTGIEHAKKHREQEVLVLRANNDRLHAQIMATQRHLIDIGDTWVYTVEPVPAFSGPAVSEVYETKLDTTTHTDETGAESTPSTLVTGLDIYTSPCKTKVFI